LQFTFYAIFVNSQYARRDLKFHGVLAFREGVGRETFEESDQTPYWSFSKIEYQGDKKNLLFDSNEYSLEKEV
jgi:hypothetical protein